MAVHEFSIRNDFLEKHAPLQPDASGDTYNIYVQSLFPENYLDVAARLAITHGRRVSIMGPIISERYIIHGDQLYEPRDGDTITRRVHYTVDALQALKTLSLCRTKYEKDYGIMADPDTFLIGYCEEFHWPPQPDETTSSGSCG